MMGLLSVGSISLPWRFVVDGSSEILQCLPGSLLTSPLLALVECVFKFEEVLGERAPGLMFDCVSCTCTVANY